jgi:hypothetical protein
VIFVELNGRIQAPTESLPELGEPDFRKAEVANSVDILK